MSGKRFKNTMFGGKFMPFHKGHLHCLEVAASESEHVNFVMFYGGEQEQSILKNDNREFLSVEDRIKHCQAIADKFDNVTFIALDISSTVHEWGEDWNEQTPLVIAACGQLDGVYGNEPSYASYFEQAYPGAVYRMFDKERSEVHISATMVRAMPDEEAAEWIV